MSKLISHLGMLTWARRERPELEIRPEPTPRPAWSPLFCKMIAINLVETTVKPTRWR